MSDTEAENVEEESDIYLPKDQYSDATRSRLISLKAIIRNILLSNDLHTVISKETLKEHLHDISNEEADVVLLIINSLIPYIPSKEHSFTIMHQLPFVLLANEILELTGYKKFTRKICPTPVIRDHALTVDGPALYYMLTRKGSNPLHLFDYDGYWIDSEEVARRHQDEVFGAIFDMKVIHDTCQDYNLTFHRNMVIVPGLVTVRVLGSKSTEATSEPKEVNSNYIDALNNPEVIKESEKTEVVLNEEIVVLQNQITAASNQLKIGLKNNADVDYAKQKKDVKIQWKKEVTQANKNLLYQRLQQLKRAEFHAFNNVEQIRKEVKVSKKQQYFKRMAIRRLKYLQTTNGKDKLSVRKNNSASYDLSSSSKGLFKAEEVYVAKNSLVDENIVFSGTDNGVVTMSNTVGLTPHRFKFHLALHNRFEALADSSETGVADDIVSKYNEKEPGNSDYLKPPPSMKITAADVDVGSGQRKARKKIERMKRNTEQGKEVQSIENNLSKKPFHSGLNIQETHATFLHQRSQAEKINAFYNSKSQARSKRHIEIQSKKFRDTLCTKERNFSKREGINSKYIAY